MTETRQTDERTKPSLIIASCREYTSQHSEQGGLATSARLPCFYYPFKGREEGKRVGRAGVEGLGRRATSQEREGERVVREIPKREGKEREREKGRQKGKDGGITKQRIEDMWQTITPTAWHYNKKANYRVL